MSIGLRRCILPLPAVTDSTDGGRESWTTSCISMACKLSYMRIQMKKETIDQPTVEAMANGQRLKSTSDWHFAACLPLNNINIVGTKLMKWTNEREWRDPPKSRDVHNKLRQDYAHGGRCFWDHFVGTGGLVWQLANESLEMKKWKKWVRKWETQVEVHTERTYLYPVG